MLQGVRAPWRWRQRPLWEIDLCCCNVWTCLVSPPKDDQGILQRKNASYAIRIYCFLFFFLTTSLGADGLTWPRHAAANRDGVFASPLVQLLTHLLHLGWIESPQAAFTRRVSALVLYLDKALVEGEVVAHRVLPSIRSCLMMDRVGQRMQCKDQQTLFWNNKWWQRIPVAWFQGYIWEIMKVLHDFQVI